MVLVVSCFMQFHDSASCNAFDGPTSTLVPAALRVVPDVAGS